MSAEAIQDEISAALRRLADPVVAGESVKACLRRAATRAGLPYGQAKRLLYREVKNIPAHLYLHIKEKASAHDRRLKASMFQALAAMQETDPDFFDEQIQAVSELLFLAGDKTRSSGPMG